MTFDRGDAIAAGVLAVGIAIIVTVVIPRIDAAIAAFDLLFGGFN